MATSLMHHITEEEVVDLTRQLVNFNTVNPPGNEEKAVRYLGEYLRSTGVEIDYQCFAPERANLIARLPGTGQRRHLVLSGHMDVVPLGEQAWDHDPFGAERVDDRLVGRGTADMKGGVAAMAVALATLARAGFQPRGDLILAITAGEEAEGVGARHMVDSNVLAGSGQLIIGEPTGLDVYIAHKGVFVMRITAHGQTAHSALPELGVSAISYMAHVIPALEANPFPFPPSDILSNPTVSATMIRGGEKPNVIPDSCSLLIVMRTVPGQASHELVSHTQQLLDTIAAKTGMTVRSEVEVLANLGPVITQRDHPLVQTVVEVATAVRSSAPTIGGVSYGTDAFALSHGHGLPTVIFGPGRFDQAHQTNEYVAVSELPTAARAYMVIAERLLT